MRQEDRPGADAMESLYPFLYSDQADLSAVLEQVRASTVAKVQEIGELRDAVCARDGTRMAGCAQQMAARFGTGGRLFAFGNGGSATDAQQLATLSTSGNSGNLLRAFDEASRRGMLTVGLAGYDGGKMAELDSIDHLFVAPSASVHRIQEAQTTIYQVLWELTLAALGALSPLNHQEEVSHVPRHTR